VIGSVIADVSAHGLQEHYEQLREAALDHEHRRPCIGLTILLTRGLCAWAQTWLRNTAQAPCEATASAVDESESTLPAGVRAEVVGVLASMALRGLEEELR
jgi:hypothetical protein